MPTTAEIANPMRHHAPIQRRLIPDRLAIYRLSITFNFSLYNYDRLPQ